MGQVCEHACGAARDIFHPTRNGHQLLVLVRCRVCVPIYHSQAQLRMVEQVQLYHGCRVGLWHGTFPADDFLYAATAERWVRSELVGQLGL